MKSLKVSSVTAADLPDDNYQLVNDSTNADAPPSAEIQPSAQPAAAIKTNRLKAVIAVNL